MDLSSDSLNGVNLKLLQTFVLVGQYCSFRIAAEKTFRSQSAVSAQIRQLEKQLGVVLFHRTTRSVRLTDDGLQLMDCLHRAFQIIDTGVRTLRESIDMRRGKVSFSCSPSIAENRLAQGLAAFSKDYPDIEVSVRELTSSAMFDSVRKSEVDFGIGPEIDTTEFAFETILEEPIYAVVHRDQIGEKMRSIALSNLLAMPLLVLNDATALRAQLEQALSDHNLVLPRRYEFTQAQTLISMAAAQLGAAILPEVAIPSRLNPRLAALRIVKPSLKRRIAFVTLRGNALPPAASRLMDLLRSSIPEPPPA